MIRRVFKTFRQKRDLTTGSLSKNLMLLALPLIVGNSFQTLFNLVDMFWVGKLGKIAIASVAMSGTILMVIMVFIGGLSVGTVAMVSRFVGAKEGKKAEEVAMQSLIMAVLGSATLAVVGAFLSPFLLKILGAESSVIREGAPYLQILLIGSISMFFMFIFTGILQGVGDTLTPTLVLAVSTVINIILDPFMIFGIGFFPRMGVSGAAWATLISQLVGVAISIEVLLRGRSHIRLDLSDITINWNLIFKIIKIGVPASLQMGIRSLTYAVLMAIVAGFGTAAVAAYGIGARLNMLMLMPAFGFGAAASTLVGQNLGAKNPSRAAQSGWLAMGYLTLVLIAVGVPGFIFAKQVVGFFNNSTDVVEIGSVFMRYSIVGLLFMPLGLVLGRAMGGAGDTMSPLILTALVLIGIQIPLAIWLPHIFSLGIIGVWIASVAASVILGVATAAWFGVGRWKMQKV